MNLAILTTTTLSSSALRRRDATVVTTLRVVSKTTRSVVPTVAFTVRQRRRDYPIRWFHDTLLVGYGDVMNATRYLSLVLTNHLTSGWHYHVSEEHQVLGRSNEVDIPVPKQFRTVSRRHAELWMDLRGCWIRDLGSRQGTRVNLIWIDRLASAELLPGDLIRVGPDLEIQVVAGNPCDERPDDFLFDGEADASSEEATALPAALVSPRKLLREQITPAETEVLLWISRGFLDNEQLGQHLHRSPNTVRTQVNSILRKLALHNRGEIVGWLKRSANGLGRKA